MNTAVEALNQAADVWWDHVLHATWQSSLVAGVLLAAVWIGRRLPAKLRYGIVLIALVKFAVPPMLSTPIGVFSWLGPTVALNDGDYARNEVGAAVPDGSEGPQTAVNRTTRASGNTHFSVSMTWRAGLMLLHALGALVAGGWIAGQLVRVLRMGRRAQTVTEGPFHECVVRLSRRIGIRRPVRLLVSSEAVPPMAFGLLRPCVMVPAAMLQDVPPHQVRTVLGHELAHHRRHDLWVNWLQIALGIVWWFNPVLWVLNRVVRKMREDCCDDLLLSRKLTTGRRYCEALLKVAAQLGASVRLGVAPGFAERLHPLGARMRRIMDPRLRRPPKPSWKTFLPLIILGALLFPGLRSAPGTAAGESSDILLAATEQSPTGGQPKTAANISSDGIPRDAALLDSREIEQRELPAGSLEDVPSVGRRRSSVGTHLVFGGPYRKTLTVSRIPYRTSPIDGYFGTNRGGTLGNVAVNHNVHTIEPPARPRIRWNGVESVSQVTRRRYHELPAQNRPPIAQLPSTRGWSLPRSSPIPRDPVNPQANLIGYGIAGVFGTGGDPEELRRIFGPGSFDNDTEKDDTSTPGGILEKFLPADPVEEPFRAPVFQFQGRTYVDNRVYYAVPASDLLHNEPGSLLNGNSTDPVVVRIDPNFEGGYHYTGSSLPPGTTVPEPATLSLLVLGALALLRRRRRFGG